MKVIDERRACNNDTKEIKENDDYDYYEYIKETKDEIVEEITKRIINEMKREKNNVINNIYVKDIDNEDQEEEIIEDKKVWTPVIVIVSVIIFFLFIIVYFNSNNEISDNNKTVEEKVVMVTPVTESAEETEELIEESDSDVIESLFSFADNTNESQLVDFNSLGINVKESIIKMLESISVFIERIKEILK